MHVELLNIVVHHFVWTSKHIQVLRYPIFMLRHKVDVQDMISMHRKVSVKFDDSAHMLCSFSTVEHWPERSLSIQIITTVPVDDLQSGGACLSG